MSIETALREAAYSKDRTHGIHDHDGADCREYVVGECIVRAALAAEADRETGHWLDLASLDTVDLMTRALRSWPPIPDEFLLHKKWVESDWLPNAREYAAALIEAMKREMGG